MADEPTREELLAVYNEVKRRQAEEQNQKPSSGDPQQPQREVITQKPQATYEELRTEWNKRGGIVKNDATFDTGMSTDEDKQYQKLKNEWYSRQGKRSPEAMRKKWDQRLQNDEKKYNR